MDSVVHYVREQKTHHASGTVIPYYERIDKRD